jgi:hypothetical protein
LPCVSFDIAAHATSWLLYRAGAQVRAEIPIRPRLSVSGADAAVDAAIAGAGVTRLLHYQVAGAIERGELQIILPECEPAPSPVHLLHASRGRMPLKMRSFIDFAATRLKDRLAILAGIAGTDVPPAQDYQRNRRGPTKAPIPAANAMPNEYQVSTNSADTSGQCRQ